VNDESVQRRLDELSARTRALAPNPGFRARVMSALAVDASAAFRAEIVRSARRFVPVAVLIAVVSLGWAAQIDGVSSAAIAVVEDTQELEW